jgi:putative holliday junction resolvase
VRYLALDLGGRRIGVAVSDSSGMLARPIEVFERRSRVADFNHIRGLAEQHGAEAVIVGLPLHLDGTEGQQAGWVRSYSTALGEVLPIPITLWDERLSSEAAIEILREQGRDPRKEPIDAVAAAVILQSYLDSQRDCLA